LEKILDFLSSCENQVPPVDQDKAVGWYKSLFDLVKCLNDLDFYFSSEIKKIASENVLKDEHKKICERLKLINSIIKEKTGFEMDDEERKIFNDWYTKI
jgi:hypothetical protein